MGERGCMSKGFAEEIVWGRGYGRGRRDEGGGVCSRIRDEIEMMERVEHNTTIAHNVMNKDGI